MSTRVYHIFDLSLGKYLRESGNPRGGVNFEEATEDMPFGTTYNTREAAEWAQRFAYGATEIRAFTFDGE